MTEGKINTEEKSSSVRLAELYAERRIIDSEIRSLLADTRDRKQLECLRCGYKWFPRWNSRPPRHCARCHSSGWNDPAILPSYRKPTDAPNPKWKRAGRQVKRSGAALLDRIGVSGIPPPPSPGSLSEELSRVSTEAEDAHAPE